MWTTLVLPYTGTSLVTYDVFQMAARVLAIALATVVNRRQGIPARVTIGACLLCLPFGYWGARLLDMMEYAGDYPSLADALARPGSSIYGGMLASFAVLLLVTRWWHVSFLRFLDGAGPAVTLAEAVSRLGCFAAGCCYGKPWNGPWAVVFPQGSLAVSDLQARGLLAPTALESPPLHPVQLYSVGIMLIATAYLVRRFPRRAFAGEIFCLFLLFYGGLRLGVAPFRMEALASMKAFSVAFIVTGTLGLVVGSMSAARRQPSVAH